MSVSVRAAVGLASIAPGLSPGLRAVLVVLAAAAVLVLVGRRRVSLRVRFVAMVVGLALIFLMLRSVIGPVIGVLRGGR